MRATDYHFYLRPGSKVFVPSILVDASFTCSHAIFDRILLLNTELEAISLPADDECGNASCGCLGDNKGYPAFVCEDQNKWLNVYQYCEIHSKPKGRISFEEVLVQCYNIL
jgi:hypothetical protein